MRLILTIPDKQYRRLLDDAERYALESELSCLLDWVRIDEMLCDGKEWKSGYGHNGTDRTYLTEAEVDAMVCPLQG